MSSSASSAALCGADSRAAGNPGVAVPGMRPPSAGSQLAAECFHVVAWIAFLEEFCCARGGEWSDWLPETFFPLLLAAFCAMLLQRSSSGGTSSDFCAGGLASSEFCGSVPRNTCSEPCRLVLGKPFWVTGEGGIEARPWSTFGCIPPGCITLGCPVSSLLFPSCLLPESCQVAFAVPVVFEAGVLGSVVSSFGATSCRAPTGTLGWELLGVSPLGRPLSGEPRGGTPCTPLLSCMAGGPAALGSTTCAGSRACAPGSLRCTSCASATRGCTPWASALGCVPAALS